MKNEQEVFWEGEFGSDYIDRNSDAKLLASNISLFSKVLKSMQKIDSMIEFGSNIGMNIRSLNLLLPKLDIHAIEINKSACDILKKNKNVTVHNESIIGFETDRRFDLCLIKGVLIHTNPESLKSVYKSIYDSSSRYICVAEYYNPTPMSIEYRGHKDKLFKRDFAGEMLDLYSDLKLVDYGFCYHRDPIHPKDDLTWFLLEKKN